jgi:hypothetical protein
MGKGKSRKKILTFLFWQNMAKHFSFFSIPNSYKTFQAFLTLIAALAFFQIRLKIFLVKHRILNDTLS